MAFARPTLSNEKGNGGEKRLRSRHCCSSRVNNYPMRQFGADTAFGCNGCRLSTERRSNLQTTWLLNRLRPVIDAYF